MGDKTGIEWTDATWNPIRGCSKISPGCKHCYAATIAARFSGPGQPYEGLALMTPTPNFTGKVRFVREKLEMPLRWTRPRRIFVNSMSDLFHARVTDEQIALIAGVMQQAGQHTFQVLTKRADRMAHVWSQLDPDIVQWAIVKAGVHLPAAESRKRAKAMLEAGYDPAAEPAWPPPNVWMGVSAENQVCLDLRVPYLLDTPAAIRFVSAEPLLGPLNLRVRPHASMCLQCGQGPNDPHEHPGGYRTRGLDWIIAGGESGADARPCHPGWIRAIRDQCLYAGVPFLFKQWGEWIGAGQVVDGKPPCDTKLHRWPDGMISSRVGKLQAGRLLDGQLWDQYPAN